MRDGEFQPFAWRWCLGGRSWSFTRPKVSKAACVVKSGLVGHFETGPIRPMVGSSSNGYERANIDMISTQLVGPAGI